MVDALADKSNRPVTQRKLRATRVRAADAGVQQPVQRIIDTLIAGNVENGTGSPTMPVGTKDSGCAQVPPLESGSALADHHRVARPVGKVPDTSARVACACTVVLRVGGGDGSASIAERPLTVFVLDHDVVRLRLSVLVASRVGQVARAGR